MANELVMGRRGFLRFLGASAAVTTTALAAPSVLAGPEAEERVRKIWQVSRNAPVRGGIISQRWHARDLMLERVFHDSMLPRLLHSGPNNMDAYAQTFGTARRPEESDADLRERIIQRLKAPHSDGEHFVGMDLARLPSASRSVQVEHVGDGQYVMRAELPLQFISAHFLIDHDGTVTQVEGRRDGYLPNEVHDDPVDFKREYMGDWYRGEEG